MAKADRLERLDNVRSALEGEYTAALVAALRVTAAGKWGMFDHTGDRYTRAATAPVIAELDELAAAIDKLRGQLNLPSFALHPEFLAARGKPAASAVGEPKQAQAWLARLAPIAPIADV